MTSTWITLPPPAAAAWTCSARRAKSADRIDGARSIKQAPDMGDTDENSTMLDVCPEPPGAYLWSLWVYGAQAENQDSAAFPEGLVEPVEYAKVAESGPFRLAMKVGSIAFREVH